MSVIMSGEQATVCSQIVLNVLVYIVVIYWRCHGRVVKLSNRRNVESEILKNVRPGFGVVKR